MTYEDKWIAISGSIGGAWMAYQNAGCDADAALRTIWDAHQQLLDGKRPWDRDDDEPPSTGISGENDE